MSRGLGARQEPALGFFVLAGDRLNVTGGVCGRPGDRRRRGPLMSLQCDGRADVRAAARLSHKEADAPFFKAVACAPVQGDGWPSVVCPPLSGRGRGFEVQKDCFHCVS